MIHISMSQIQLLTLKPQSDLQVILEVQGLNKGFFCHLVSENIIEMTLRTYKSSKTDDERINVY